MGRKDNSRKTAATLNKIFDDAFSGKSDGENLRNFSGNAAGASARRRVNDFFKAGDPPAVQVKSTKELTPTERKIQALQAKINDTASTSSEVATAKKLIKRLEARRAQDGVK